MSKSIMQKDKKCYITGQTKGLHKHHVFGGPNRKKSEQWGCWVYLIPYYHNMSNEGVHFNRTLDLELKRKCQEKFESMYGHQLFMREFGRSYLEGDYNGS